MTPSWGSLAKHSDTALVRYLAVRVARSAPLREPLRILVVIAKPSNVPLPPIETYPNGNAWKKLLAT